MHILRNKGGLIVLYNHQPLNNIDLGLFKKNSYRRFLVAKHPIIIYVYLKLRSFSSTVIVFM